MAIRVVVAEDSLLVREGICELLAHEPDVEVVAAVGDLPSLRARRRRARAPTSCSPTSGCRPTRRTRASGSRRGCATSHPEIGVVVLSQYADPAYALALLERGSDRRAYLLKDRVRNRAELLAAIRAVAAGGSMIDPKIVEALVDARTRADALAAERADPARARGARARSLRARATRRSPSRCSSPSAPSRSTSTRSS